MSSSKKPRERTSEPQGLARRPEQTGTIVNTIQTKGGALGSIGVVGEVGALQNAARRMRAGEKVADWQKSGRWAVRCQFG